MHVTMVSVLAQSLAETAINKAVEELIEYSDEVLFLDKEDEKLFYYCSVDILPSCFSYHNNSFFDPSLGSVFSSSTHKHGSCIYGVMNCKDIKGTLQDAGENLKKYMTEINTSTNCNNIAFPSKDIPFSTSPASRDTNSGAARNLSASLESKPITSMNASSLQTNFSTGELHDSKSNTIVSAEKDSFTASVNNITKDDGKSNIRLTNGIVDSGKNGNNNVETTLTKPAEIGTMVVSLQKSGSERHQEAGGNKLDELHTSEPSDSDMSGKSSPSNEDLGRIIASCTDNVSNTVPRRTDSSNTASEPAVQKSPRAHAVTLIPRPNITKSGATFKTHASIDQKSLVSGVIESSDRGEPEGIFRLEGDKSTSMDNTDDVFESNETFKLKDNQADCNNSELSSDVNDSVNTLASTSNSETKLANKRTFLISKLPVKTTGSVSTKAMASGEKSPKSNDSSGFGSLRQSGNEIESKDDSYLPNFPERDVQEMERCLSAVEGGEKRRSRGLWSQSWNPETILQHGLKHDDATKNVNEMAGFNSLEKSASDRSSTSDEPPISTPSSRAPVLGFTKDENDNYCITKETLDNQCRQEPEKASSSDALPIKGSNVSSDMRTLLPKPIRSATASSLEEMNKLQISEVSSPKPSRSLKLNSSDSCIPVHITSRGPPYKRERPLSGSSVIGAKGSQEASTITRSMLPGQQTSDGKLSVMTPSRSLSCNSCELEPNEPTLSGHEFVFKPKDTSSRHSCLTDVSDLPVSKSSGSYVPLSSTPIKLPGAAREALRQRQVMEVSPSFDHLASESSVSGRPSTLNMMDLDSSSEDGCFMDNSQTDRWNRESVQSLKTKHSRQIHDLQAYYETELRRLQEEISDLHRRVVSRPSSSPMIRLKYLEQIREELDQRCQQFERRNTQLQEDCERWSQRCFEMERRCRTSECERQTVYERCSRLEQEKSKVEVELLKTQEMLNDSFRERRQLEEHLLTLQKKEFAWNGMFKQEGHTILELQSELQSIRDLCQDKDDTIKSLEKHRDELKRNLDNTIHQVEELKEAMCVTPKDRDLFQKLLEEYETLYRQHQKMRAMYKDAIDKMESNAVEVDVLKGLLSKLENDCSKMRESKDLLGSSADNKSKIPVRADPVQIKKKDSISKRDLFKPSLNIFQTPGSSSVDLTASDNESVQSDKQIGRRYRTPSTSEKTKDTKIERRSQNLSSKIEDYQSPMVTGVPDSTFAGSIWESAERDISRSSSFSSRNGRDSKANANSSSLSWSVPFGDDSPRQPLKGDMLKRNIQRERKNSDSTYSDSSKQSSPALSRKEQNWVIESRGGVTRFDVVFDGPNKNKPSKPREIVRPEKELDAYGPASSTPKRPMSSKDTSCASSADESENGFLTRFSSDTSSPRVHMKKDYRAGRTSTLLAGERDTKAYEERKLKVSDLEQEFKKLTQEKESIESQLRKLPTGRTTRKKLDEKGALEERLEQVLKRIGTVRMNLRRFDAL